VTAANLRRRAARVRRLMGGMTSKADYDRLREYADEMDARAVVLEGSEPRTPVGDWSGSIVEPLHQNPWEAGRARFQPA
jgi:hypothetical protein